MNCSGFMFLFKSQYKSVMFICLEHFDIGYLLNAIISEENNNYFLLTHIELNLVYKACVVFTKCRRKKYKYSFEGLGYDGDEL